MSLVCLTYSTIITIHLRYSRGTNLQVYGQILFDLLSIIVPSCSRTKVCWRQNSHSINSYITESKVVHPLKV